jgi:hypothetical protein
MYRTVDSSIFDTYGSHIFINGLSVSSVRRQVRMQESTYQLDNNCRPPLSKLINWAAAAEKSEAEERDSKFRRQETAQVRAVQASNSSKQAQPSHSRTQQSSDRPQRSAAPRLETGENISQFKFYKAANCCWRCGSAGHSFRDRSCLLFPKTAAAPLN